MSNVQAQIAQIVAESPVVLFMKGNRDAPQCGFSAKVVAALDEYLPEYATVDVLSAPDIRDGIKEFSSWPTIPQLYVKGEFVGGCDIVTEMSENGELDEVLGLTRAELKTPEVFLTPGALTKLKEFAEGQPIVIRLEISGRWQYGLDFDSARPNDVVVKGSDWTVVMARGTARKADGMTVDFVEGPEGAGFKIDNPNEPAKVQQLEVEQAKEWLDGGKPFEFIDVRTADERATASIEGTRFLDDECRAFLDGLDRAATIVFQCHHGGRSQRAAEHAISQGFLNVYNLRGGIDAWSQDVDPSVPRY